MKHQNIQKTKKFSTFFFIIILSEFIFFHSHSFANFEPMLDESAMDLSADPCENFEQFACGNWNARTVIPADKSAWYRSFTSIDEENLKINRALLEDFAAGKNLNLTPNTKKLGNFYASCIDTKSIANETEHFLKKEFEQLDKLNAQNLYRFIGNLQNKDIDVLMSFNSGQDYHDSSKTIAMLDQGGLGLPSRDYYFEENQAQVREKYVPHIAKMLELSGVPQKEAETSAQFIMKFETALAQNALRPVDRRDPSKVYHIKTMQELESLAPNIQWNTLFSAMQTPKFTTLNVVVPEFFTNLNALMAKTPLTQIKMYLRWHIISTYSPDLGGEFAKEHFNFYEKTLQGQQEMKPRWQYCVDQTDSSLADALGQAFVAKTFGQESKTTALNILNSIQKVYQKNLETMSWMDENTRKYAVEKLNAFTKKIGYPETWRDLSKLSIHKNYMENISSAAQFERTWELAKIGKPTDRTEWDMTPDTVNAYYNPSNNEIVFPAGILQSPIFNVNAPMAANYGAFGAVIGHEMSHGFDDEGRQFDLNGNLKDWWSPGVNKEFEQKAQCLVDQYSAYTVADNFHIDGKLTLGENIADLGGVKMALAALNASLPSNISNEERTAEEKKFFISFGQVWCAKVTPELEKMRATTDPHSPPKFRINGVLTNTPEFAKTFQCKEASPLAPVHRCSIW